MSAAHISGRSLATALGVSEKAVRKAVEAGRISRESDGLFDLAVCREKWCRTTDPARSKVRTTADHAPGPQSAPTRVRTQSAPLPQADLAGLWDIVSELPALAAWIVIFKDAGLQTAFDLATDLALDIAGDLEIRGFGPPPIAFEATDWTALAKEAGLDPIDPAVLLAAWQGDRDAG